MSSPTPPPSSASPKQGVDFVWRRRSRIKRAKNPPPMWMTPQRQQILEAVWRYRVLNRDQIQCVAGYASRNTVNYALGLLYHHGYLERRFAPPLHAQAGDDHQALYLLDRKGAEFLAAQHGFVEWRELGWKGQDNHIQWWHLHHLIACNECLLRFALAAQTAKCAIEWLAERDLRQPERQGQVEIQRPGGQRKKMAVVADAYVMLTPAVGQRLACFLECDRGTVDIARRWTDKILGYGAFIPSSLYPRCFPIGQHNAAVLTVTTSAQRLAHLKAAAERASQERFFFFSTFAEITSANLLTDPVWQITHTPAIILCWGRFWLPVPKLPPNRAPGANSRHRPHCPLER